MIAEIRFLQKDFRQAKEAYLKVSTLYDPASRMGGARFVSGRTVRRRIAADARRRKDLY